MRTGRVGSASLRQELADLFTGDLSFCRDKILLPGEGGSAIPAARLIKREFFDRALARFGAAYPGSDRRAVVSLWSQWYLSALIVPSTAATFLLNLRLPLGLDELGVVLDECTGRPAAFRLARAGWVDPDASPSQRLQPLLRRHLDPLLRALAAHGRLAPRVLWGNAGHYLEWTLQLLEKRVGGEAAASAYANLFNNRAWPDGRPNPLVESIRYVEVDGRRVRRRRVCCLRYLLPGVEGCGDLCPLAKE